MAIRLLRPARRRLEEVWSYTVERWSLAQADRYVRGLNQAISSLGLDRRKRRVAKASGIEGLFVARYRYHYFFYRVLPSGDIAVITILHQQMDMPERLKEDANAAEDLGSDS